MQAWNLARIWHRKKLEPKIEKWVELNECDRVGLWLYGTCVRSKTTICGATNMRLEPKLKLIQSKMSYSGHLVDGQH